MTAMELYKKVTIRLCILALSLGALACAGNPGDEPAATLKLQPSTQTITANGSDAVTFTVFDGTTDVTADAAIRCTTNDTPLAGASFSTSSAGDYLFTARYAGRTSNEVKVTAKAGNTPDIEPQFVRHICVMEFTGQWCANCPTGYNYMQFIIARNFKDTAHVIALHDNTSGEDEFAIDVQRHMCLDFAVPGYPAAVVDMRDLCPLTSDIDQTFKKSLERSQEAYPAHCGVAVKSVYDQTTQKATTTVRIFSEKTETYRVALWVVEDGLAGKQNISGQYSDYTHNHVARLLVSSSPNNYKGENLGEIPANTEKSKTFEVAVDPAWNLEKTSVYALAIDAEGYVNNMSICKIAGGDTDYDRVTE